MIHLAFVYGGENLTIYVKEYDATLVFQENLCVFVRIVLVYAMVIGMVTDAIVSEVRFWTTAISQSQIQNNMFAITGYGWLGGLLEIE